MKIKLVFAYDGSFFKGSANDVSGCGVVNALNKALFKLGFTSPILLASRTDKGVHATRAVGAVDCPGFYQDLQYLKMQLNRSLKPHIFIREIKEVENDFEPRFDAYERGYRYIFCHESFSPFKANYVHFTPKMNLSFLNELLTYMQGEHDFSLLCKQEKRNRVRSLNKAYAYTYKNHTVVVFLASGFLRGQIRMSISLLLKAVLGVVSLSEFKNQVDGKRQVSWDLVPPNALYLHKITYRNDFKGYR